jgi:hypothetical protein
MNFERLCRNFALTLSSVLLASQIAFAQDPMEMAEVDAAETAIVDAEFGAEPATTDDATEQSQKTAAVNTYKSFVHEATIANGAGNYVTYLDDPMLNGHPEAIVLATPNWNPPGGGGVYNNHPIGVWYNPFEEKWTVFNQDFAPILDGSSFNIRVGSGFLHQANPSNISSHVTTIDNPLSNNNPTAKVVVTPVWINGVGGVYVNHNIGVYYWAAQGKWAIYNQDIAPMPNKALFHVLIGEGFVHKAVQANISGHVTYIDSPQTNGKPEAKLIVTQNWNPNGQGGTYDDHAIGVYYTGGKWAIFNQDFAAMPVNAAFNVVVVNSPKITNVYFQKKKLIVEGENFGNGAVVMVNGVNMTTVASLSTPSTKLMVRKAAKTIPVGATVTIEVQNADGLMSASTSFTRQ